jgi:predicted PurR-regulated permease PerM
MGLITSEAIERAIGGIALGLLAAGCIAILWPFGTALVWAGIIVFSTWPLFSRLTHALKGRRSAAAAVMTLCVAALLVAPLAVAANSVVDDVSGLVSLMRQWLEVGPPGPPDWVKDVPVFGQNAFDRWEHFAHDGAAFTSALTPYLGTARTVLLDFGATLGGGLAKLLLSLAIAFFIYRRGDVLARHLEINLDRVGGKRARRLAHVAGGMVRGVVYGVLGTNLLQSILAGIGFAIAGVPGALLIGMLCFFLTLVPLGPTLVWLPAVIWLFTSGHTIAAVFLGVWSLVLFNAFESVMRVYLIGRSSDLPMMLLLLGMFGGLFTLGFLGLFVGPTLLAVGYALINEWSAERAAPVDLE